MSHSQRSIAQDGDKRQYIFATTAYLLALVHRCLACTGAAGRLCVTTTAATSATCGAASRSVPVCSRSTLVAVVLLHLFAARVVHCGITHISTNTAIDGRLKAKQEPGRRSASSAAQLASAKAFCAALALPDAGRLLLP